MKKTPEIIFVDDDILVVNKPSGITVIPDRIHTERETLQNIFEKKFGKLFVVHRIDRGTSGILCFARNETAHRHLSLQFQNHQVKKKYLTFVSGKMASTAGEIDLPIAESKTKPGTMLINKRGKNALTLYEVEEQFKHAALLKVEIKTGRTHQIRVHLAHLGNPLLVDEVYGNTEAFYFSKLKKNYKASGEEERPTIARLTLHAHELSFKHPVQETEITLVAPLPKDMETLLKLLRKYDA